jgi:hypothetical protein
VAEIVCKGFRVGEAEGLVVAEVVRTRRIGEGREGSKEAAER